MVTPLRIANSRFGCPLESDFFFFPFSVFSTKVENHERVLFWEILNFLMSVAIMYLATLYCAPSEAPFSCYSKVGMAQSFVTPGMFGFGVL